jgi:site-specific recombinase XerD
LITKIENYESYCYRNNIEVTCEGIRKNLLKPLSKSMNIYMNEQFELDKPTLSEGRIRQVQSILNNFDAYGSFTFISFDDDALRGYHNHLLKTMQDTTTKKNHNVIKKYLSRAFRSGLVQRNIYDNFKIPKEAEKRVFLTSDELERLRQYKGVERIEKVRDRFLFMCLTGFAFTDLNQLTPLHIFEESGKKYIIKERQKTDIVQVVPLLPEALALIEIYSNDEFLFPDMSNQRMNAYLKELGDICQVKKEITSHVARHTFATILLTNGMPLESISKMMGHATTKMTGRYAQMLTQKLSNDFERLKIKGL